MKSILTRLLVYNAAVMIAIQLLAFTGLFFAYSAGLRRSFDHAMLQKLELMFQSKQFKRLLDPTITGTERSDLEAEINRSFYLVAQRTHPFQITFLQIWDEKGEELFRSESLPSTADLCRPEDFPENHAPAYGTISYNGGLTLSRVIVNLSTNDPRFVDLFPTKNSVENPDNTNQLPTRLVFAIARNTRPLQNSLDYLRTVLLITSGLSVLLTLCGNWFVTRSGIQPVAELGNQIRDLSNRDLNQRIDNEVPIELQIIKATLNDYLERIQIAFERERSFNHDVAHELKTPISALLTKIELSLRRPRPAEQQTKTLEELQSVANDLQSIVTRMLELASLETDRLERELSEISLKQTLQEIWQQVSVSKKVVPITWTFKGSDQWKTDPILFQVLLQNILKNAFHYSPDGGEVLVHSENNATGLKLKVTNSGSDLEPEDLKMVFSRFWRKSASRKISDGRCGLGLTISKQIVDCLGGEINATTNTGQFIITISFPSRKN